MSKHELPKAYDFKDTEPRIYEMWEKGGYFKPWNDPNKPGFDPSVKPYPYDEQEVRFDNKSAPGVTLAGTLTTPRGPGPFATVITITGSGSAYFQIANPVVGDISVVSLALPYNRETMRVNALEKEGPALRWNHTRWKGQDFNNELVTYVTEVLAALGIEAVAPDQTPFFRIVRPPEPLASTWSHRHIAYAAGLGTFSLNDGFITSKGIGVRCNSFLINVKLEPSARRYADHLANCSFYASGACGACIDRCPGAAITAEGHDKLKCYQVLFVQQKPWIDGAHGPGYIGDYAGCGLCQTGVPCATRIPVNASPKTD